MRSEETKKSRTNSRYTTPAATERKLAKDEAELASLQIKQASLHTFAPAPEGRGGFDIVIAYASILEGTRQPATADASLDVYTWPIFNIIIPKLLIISHL